MSLDVWGHNHNKQKNKTVGEPNTTVKAGNSRSSHPHSQTTFVTLFFNLQLRFVYHFLTIMFLTAMWRQKTLMKSHTDKYIEKLNCAFQCMTLVSIYLILYKPLSWNLLGAFIMHPLILGPPLAMMPDGMSHQCHTTGPLGSFGRYALSSLGDTQTPEACASYHYGSIFWVWPTRAAEIIWHVRIK